MTLSSNDMLDFWHAQQRRWKEEAKREASRPLSVGEQAELENRTSVRRSCTPIHRKKKELDTSSRLRQKSENAKTPLRLYGKGHGRKFNVNGAVRTFEPGMRRSQFVKRIAEQFELEDRVARRWVKRLEDEGYLQRRRSSPVTLEATEKTARLRGWRKGKEALAGVVSEMPANARRDANRGGSFWREQSKAMFERFGTERVPLGAYQAMSEEEHWRRVQTVIGSDGIVRPAP